MLFAIFLLLILLCLWKPKSKRCFVLLLCYLWFLAAFCYKHADYHIYETRYYSYQLLSANLEPLFSLIMAIFNGLSFSFESFLQVVYAAILGVYGWFILKHSRRPGVVLALFAFVPYAVDMVQLRTTMSFAVILIGIDCLLSDKKYAIFKFLLCTVIATGIHIVSALYILLLLPYFLSINKIIIVSFVAAIFGMLLVNQKVVFWVARLLSLESVLQRVYAYSINYSTEVLRKIYVTIFATFLFSVIPLWMAKLGIKGKRVDPISVFFIQYTQKVAVVAMVIIVFVTFSADVYRIQRYCLILIYIANDVGASLLTTQKASGKIRVTKQQLLYCAVYVVAFALLFYVQIRIIGNHKLTFEAFFNYNRLLN